jgi:hypothetical protein
MGDVAVGRPAHLVPVGRHRDRAVSVRAQDTHTGVFEAFERVSTGVAEGIASAGADERQLRTPCVEQLLTGRRPAAMVRHLQDAHACRRELRHERPFDLVTHVTEQQHRDVAEGHLQHH